MADISADLQQELDELQAAYKAAVDEWVKAIREEEALASRNHSVAELDKWEAAWLPREQDAEGSDSQEEALRGRAAARILRLLIPEPCSHSGQPTIEAASSP